ncbi:MAG: M56 family metallopeptidase, partial [Bacteroidota bacterium]
MNKFALFLQQPWTEAIGWTILHSLWIGALLTLLWRLSLIGRKTPEWRYLSALITLGAMLVIVIGTFGWELSQIQPLPELSVSSQELTLEKDAAIVLEFGNQSYAPTWSERLQQMVKPYFPWLSLAWLAGIILLSFRLLLGWLYLEYLRRSGQVIVPLQWQERLQAMSLQMQIKRQVRLLESSLLEHPITMGFFKPVILFPMGMISGMSNEQIEAILLHELAHIKRADYLINYFQTLVEIVLFYHPAVWWISQDLRESREHCCDDLALQQGYDRWQYAQALLQLTKTNISSKTTFAMSLTGNKHSQLSRRIHRLFGRSTPDRFMSRGLLMAILLSGSMMTWAFHRAPTTPESPELETPVSETESPASERFLFNVQPNASVETMAKYNLAIQEHGYEFSLIVRDENMAIQEISIDKTEIDEYPALQIKDFDHIEVYLTGEKDHMFRFQTDGEISFEIEEEASSLSDLAEGILPPASPNAQAESPRFQALGKSGVPMKISKTDSPGSVIPDLLSQPIPAFVFNGKLLTVPAGKQIPIELQQLWGPDLITMKSNGRHFSFMHKEQKSELTASPDTVTAEGISVLTLDGDPILRFGSLGPQEATERFGAIGQHGAIVIWDKGYEYGKSIQKIQGEPLFVINGVVFDQRPKEEIRQLIEQHLK